MKIAKGTVFIVLGLAGAAGVWYFLRRREAFNPSVPTSNPSAYNPAQPSQQYPWQPTVAPRVDNSNQPWYSGPRGFMSGPSEDLGNTALLLQSGTSIIHSVEDIWGNFDDFFGSADELNIASDSDLFSDNMSVGGEGYFQSDNVGEMFA